MGINRLSIIVWYLLLSSLLSCQVTENDALEERKSSLISISLQMPSDETETRVGMDIKKESKDLSARWQEDDSVQIVAWRGNEFHDLGKSKVLRITDDGKYALFNADIREYPSLQVPFILFCFTGNDYPGTVDSIGGGAWAAVCSYDIKRGTLENFKAPMYCRIEVNGKDISSGRFQHVGTYELLHITNETDKPIMFSHRGFEVGTPWYRGITNVWFTEDYNHTKLSGEWEGEAVSSEGIVLPHTSRAFISWYIPSGYKIADARLIANINGNTVLSSNTFSSNASIQRNHAYHMYATWDGKQLTFDKGNKLLDELGLGFTRLELQEKGSYGFVTGREGHLSFESTNPSVASAIETDDVGEPHVNIEAYSIGTAIITITDTKSKEKSQIEVSVTERTEFGIELEVGKTESLTMHNVNGDYEAFSDNVNIASCEVKGNTVFVTAKSLGETIIHVTERGTNKRYSIHVLVYSRGHAVPEIVDLGLSVKWASFNLGATKPEEYGNYYAWGEVAIKNDYRESNYKWYQLGKDNRFYITKYCNDDAKGYEGYWDGLHTLSPEDDAASVNLGGKWRIPTKGEFLELIDSDNCSLAPTSINGILGISVTSLINGNSIFLPYSGDGYHGRSGIGVLGDYWSSTVEGYDAYYLHIWDLQRTGVGRAGRFFGFSIRPVYGEEPDQTKEYVDLGLPSGTKWAKCNLGASTPEEYGDYFARGEIAPKIEYSEENYTTGIPYSFYPGSQYDAARMRLGANWKMPTNAQMSELHDYCSLDVSIMNGKEVLEVIGPNGNRIVIPMSGYKTNREVRYEGEYGFLWTSSSCWWWSCMHSDDEDPQDWPRAFMGSCIRPVYVPSQDGGSGDGSGDGGDSNGNGSGGGRSRGKVKSGSGSIPELLLR